MLLSKKRWWNPRGANGLKTIARVTPLLRRHVRPVRTLLRPPIHSAHGRRRLASACGPHFRELIKDQLTRRLEKAKLRSSQRNVGLRG